MSDPGISYRDSLELFGNPLREPFMITTGGDSVWTRYFERAVFDLHPENVYLHRLLPQRRGWQGRGAMIAPTLIRK